MFSVYLDDVLSYKLELTPDILILTLKEYFKPYDVRMFLSKNKELEVFSSDLYDAMSLESVWNQVDGGYVLLTTTTIGKIRIGQQRRATAYPEYDDYEIISAWSRGKAPWKQLSPFYLGPVKYESEAGLVEAKIFENFYQSAKTWEVVEKQNTKNWKWPKEVHVDEVSQNPNQKWFNWHRALMAHDLPVRRPNGSKVPLYAYWYNPETKLHEKLDTIGGRRKIYIPTLKKLYREHPVYAQLLEKVRSGKNIMIVEPDGPLLDAYPQGREMNLELLESLIDKMNYGDEGFPHKYSPYGHSAVLATCLLEDA